MADPASYRPAPGSIPTNPGVYRFSDPHGVVIYVGKAKNLRQRLNSYFADPASLHFRTQTMVRTAAKVEWTVVQNELESLQLEYTWIEQYDPRFNIKYRDDKSYPWVAITWSEEFPRVFVGRGAKRKGNRYFGPYAQAWAIRDTIDSLLRVFPMRSCSAGVFRNAKASGRPCRKMAASSQNVWTSLRPQRKYVGSPAKKPCTPAPANTVGKPQLSPGTSVMLAVRICAPN